MASSFFMYILRIKHFFTRSQIVLYYKYIRIARGEGKKFYIFLQIKFKKASEFGGYFEEDLYTEKSACVFACLDYQFRYVNIFNRRESFRGFNGKSGMIELTSVRHGGKIRAIGFK